MICIPRLAFLFAVAAVLAPSLLAQPLEADLPPLDSTRHFAPGADGGALNHPSAMRRVFGHLNVVGTQDATRDGIGVFDVPDALPPSFLIPTTKLADNPIPYETFTPSGGTLGPGGLFYFVGYAGSDMSDLTLYTLDTEAPGAGYTLVSDGVEEGLFASGIEHPVALGYNASTGAATLVTRLCAEVEGVYYQSFLYDIDLTTGVLGDRMELRDPAAPTPDNAGVCLFSASWEEGARIFGANAGDGIVEIDATSGLLLESYPITDSSAETIERVQSAAFDAEEGVHHVFAFTLERDGSGEIVAAYTRAFRCAPGEGCDFRGFVVENTPSGSFTVEVLTAAFVPNPPVAVDPGASPTGTTVDVFPNPVAARASVTLRLGTPEDVSVSVLDVLGRTVAVLHEGRASQLDLTLDGDALPGGIYFVHARGESFSTVRKIAVAH